MKITIEKANSDYLKEIQYLNQLLFIKEKKDYDPLLNINWSFEKEGEEYFKKRVADKNYIIFIAKDDKKIVGYIACSSKNDPTLKGNPITAEIDNMFVLEDYRNQEIGSLLVKEFLNWSKEKKAKRVFVVASVQNQDGIRFYNKNDFKDFYITLKIDL